MVVEQCKGVHCVDLGESFQTHTYLQALASIQPRTGPLTFALKSAGSRRFSEELIARLEDEDAIVRRKAVDAVASLPAWEESSAAALTRATQVCIFKQKLILAATHSVGGSDLAALEIWKLQSS